MSNDKVVKFLSQKTLIPLATGNVGESLSTETINILILRFLRGDFGSVDGQMSRFNQSVVQHKGGSVIGIYKNVRMKNGKTGEVWVQATVQFAGSDEADTVTVMFPNER